DGRPISATEFIERLYGELPDLFRNEDELRALWSKPNTRRALLQGLAERGFGLEQLMDIARMIDAEDSDLYDVLAYVAYAEPPITRVERVARHQRTILGRHDDKKRAFLEFVLGHYVRQGVGELDESKLPQLLRLRYSAVDDAIRELGHPHDIRNLFIGFQRHLYETQVAA